MAQTKFAKSVADALCKFCESVGMGYGHTMQSMFPNNELHLQMCVARYLEQIDEKIKVLYEHHVPTELITGSNNKEVYPWRTKDDKPKEMYLDLVVVSPDAKEYVPIEIKYKTRNPMNWEMGLNVLGSQKRGIDLLRNQGAQDLGMYGFWKDVRRIELVRDNFDAVKNGIALFVTNDPIYFQNMKEEKDYVATKKKVNYHDFRMTENRHTAKGECLKWQEGSRIANDYPAFRLKDEYDIHWDRFGYYDFEKTDECDPEFYNEYSKFAKAVMDPKTFKYALLNTLLKYWAFCYCMLII